jgi:hypothetical protein
MQQNYCSCFSTSIACVWTVKTRCFLSSSNTGKKSNMFGFLPVLPEFLAILLPAVWTLQSPPLLKNEQQPISCRMLRGIPPQFSVTVERYFQQADYTSMAACLSAIKWCNIYQSCRSVNDYWSAFYNVLWKLIEAHVPTRKVRRGRAGQGFLSQ